MTDRTELPEGYQVSTWPRIDRPGYVWAVSQNDVVIGGGGVDILPQAKPQALKMAWEHWDRENPAPPVQETPAWMVEVARDGYAAREDERGFHTYASEVREGGHDDAEEVKAGVFALRLALERKHVVKSREWTEEDLLKAAREDAARALSAGGYSPHIVDGTREGHHDRGMPVQSALQARRNMLREWGGVVASVADLKAALERAWDEGFGYCAIYGKERPVAEDEAAKSRDVARILANLPKKG